MQMTTWRALLQLAAICLVWCSATGGSGRQPESAAGVADQSHEQFAVLQLAEKREDRAPIDLSTLHQFEAIEVLSLSRPSLSERDLRTIAHANCRKLKTIGLSVDQMPSGGFAPLKDLQALRSLHVVTMKLSREATESLGELKQVDELFLCDCQLDKQGLRGLERMPQLRTLNIWMSNLTDTGLKHVCAARNLEFLMIFMSEEISDEGLADFKELRHLKHLTLGSIPISDAGLAHLHSMESLEELNLSDLEFGAPPPKLPAGGAWPIVIPCAPFEMRVSEEGIKGLKAMKNLKVLELGYVSEKFQKEFRKHLPNVKLKVAKEPREQVF